ncbi:hypothetical protein N1851_000282 [Merluccius polli]|uniref:Uncharacterized protein n=1 Tax=Merluccius polli TaxID=89951 RepID=A0AA47PE15_MERPO|nr:hypothetical protein N1851_000282 [Merluccius polli]
MNEPHFKQTVRVLIDLHNEKINRSLKAEIEALCNMDLSIGLHGMLGLHVVKSSLLAQSYDVDDKDKEKLKKLLSGCRDENQTVTHSTRRHPVSIKDMRSVCPLELLAESSLAMPWHRK